MMNSQTIEFKWLFRFFLGTFRQMQSLGIGVCDQQNLVQQKMGNGPFLKHRFWLLGNATRILRSFNGVICFIRAGDHHPEPWRRPAERGSGDGWSLTSWGNMIIRPLPFRKDSDFLWMFGFPNGFPHGFPSFDTISQWISPGVPGFRPGPGHGGFVLAPSAREVQSLRWGGLKSDGKSLWKMVISGVLNGNIPMKSYEIPWKVATLRVLNAPALGIEQISKIGHDYPEGKNHDQFHRL